MKISRFFFGSVAARTTTLVLSLVTLIMLVAGFWQMHHVRAITLDEAHRQASRSMESAIAVIDNHITNIETTVETAASYANMFAPHEVLVYKLLERLIDANKDIAAVTLLYRADYFPEHGRYYAPTITRNPADGQLEEDEIGGPEHDFCYLETDSNWIYTSKLDQGYWCLPYMDSMSTKRPMVTYSVPLHDEAGKTYAVLCADIDLRWVKMIVEKAKPYDFSIVSVLSRDGQFICHPDSTLILNPQGVEEARRRGGQQMKDMTDRMLRMQGGSDTMHATQFDNTSDVAKKLGKLIIYYAPVARPQWSVSFTMPEKMIMQGPDRLRSNMLMLLAVMLLSVSLVLYLVIRAQLWPLKMLAKETRKVAKGDFNTQLPVFNTHDEISYLRNSFADMQASLAAYIDELRQTTASKASIESELKVASDIQMSMLPKLFPPFPDRSDIDLYGSLTPAKSVGGDLFDFYIRDEKLFFCIGDVSGKGVPASLVMAVTRAQFRTISNHESMPDRIVTAINDTMAEGNDSNMFVTLFVGVLDLPTGRLRYSNGGHNAPVVFSGKCTFLPCDSNLPVGCMPGWKFSGQETIIEPGTMIFLYTDGLTEAEDISHAQFGEQRMMDFVSRACDDPATTPQSLVSQASAAVSAFVGDAEQSDDLTMLAIQYTKEQLDVRLARHLMLQNDVQQVPQLAQFVDEVCEAVGFDMATTMQLNLAIEEAVVNVMNYAYPHGTVGNIDIDAEANDVRLKFVISDSGEPFDPTAKAEVDTTLSAEERPIGGLGIHLVRKIMDSINYERIDGQNVLTLRKKLMHGSI